jgi:hypothetical protein
MFHPPTQCIYIYRYISPLYPHDILTNSCHEAKQGPSPPDSMDRPEDTAVTNWEGTKKTSSNHDYWGNTPQFS